MTAAGGVAALAGLAADSSNELSAEITPMILQSCLVVRKCCEC